MGAGILELPGAAGAFPASSQWVSPQLHRVERENVFQWGIAAAPDEASSKLMFALGQVDFRGAGGTDTPMSHHREGATRESRGTIVHGPQLAMQSAQRHECFIGDSHPARRE